jgi:hypothetical protein
METDNIIEISIDHLGRLCIKPENKVYTLIWTLAKEVHWDQAGRFLYSPKPREWSYFDWFKHITTVSKEECHCSLLLTEDTLWINIPLSLKEQILQS